MICMIFRWTVVLRHLIRKERQVHTSFVGFNKTMEFKNIVSVLKRMVPLELAEDWDNVGVLIEPLNEKKISRIMLTIDLTEEVLNEAIEMKIDLIISYHPPIFKPVTHLRMNDWKSRIIMKCVKNKIGVYSPHTALDSIEGGINDWLLRCFDSRLIVPIIRKQVQFKSDYQEQMAEILPPSAEVIESTIMPETGAVEGTLKLDSNDVEALQKLSVVTDRFQMCRISEGQQEIPVTKCGSGRYALLSRPIPVSEAVTILKGHLNLRCLRVALAKDCTPESLIQSVAVCAGSGAEILHSSKANLLITGEMSHHELLDAVHRGSTVILTEHSNSERPYLPTFAQMLQQQMPPTISVVCSRSDSDPVLFM